jgi:hypothetical protein
MSAAEPDDERLRRVGATIGAKLERRETDGKPSVVVAHVVPGGLLDEARTTLAVDGYCVIRVRGIE